MAMPPLNFSFSAESGFKGPIGGNTTGNGDRNSGLTIYRDDPMSKWLMYGAVAIALFVAYKMVRK